MSRRIAICALAFALSFPPASLAADDAASGSGEQSSTLAKKSEGDKAPDASTPTSTTTTTPPTTDTTTPSGPTGATADKSTDDQGAGSKDDQEGLAIAILVLGAFGLALAYAFFDRWRTSYTRLSEETLWETGALPDHVFNPVEMSAVRPRGLGAGQAAALPTVEGPAVVVVGRAAKYTATLAGQPAQQCSWTVEPNGAGSVAPETGPETTLTASKEGVLTLKAAVGQAVTSVPLAAVKPPSSGKVPIIGIGFSGVAAAIAAFTIAGALVAVDKLSGTALIAFLGPVVGYFFANARGTGDGGGGGQGDATK